MSVDLEYLAATNDLSRIGIKPFSSDEAADVIKLCNDVKTALLIVHQTVDIPFSDLQEQLTSIMPIGQCSRVITSLIIVGLLELQDDRTVIVR